ncbi:MAG: PRC-barrel domain-containing protein [Coriobacteriaceae bacterium]|nr:PRC-barrel domain-containing protein [Coriobacteriaceae bacterium]
MYSSRDLYNKRIYITKKSRKKTRTRRFGRLRQLVLHPTKPQVVGVIVKRPDFLLMFKRKDRFVAFDALGPHEKGLLIDPEANAALDAQACKRLGIDLDTCIVWDGMPCITTTGRELGIIADIQFDEDTLQVSSIDISSGGVERAIVGTSAIDSSFIRGYKDGAIVVDDEIGAIDPVGGAAAKAGETWANVSHSASVATKKAGQQAGDAINKGAYQTGKAIGKMRASSNERQAKREAAEKKAAAEGKEQPATTVDKGAQAVGRQIGRASGMFKSFRDEYNKAKSDD